VAEAEPPETVPLVTDEPICVLPLKTENVTVPTLTADVLETVADNVTFCAAGLNVAAALPGATVVEAVDGLVHLTDHSIDLLPLPVGV
jgi:hypothetical protein